MSDIPYVRARLDDIADYLKSMRTHLKDQLGITDEKTFGYIDKAIDHIYGTQPYLNREPPMREPVATKDKVLIDKDVIAEVKRLFALNYSYQDIATMTKINNIGRVTDILKGKYDHI